MIIKSQLKMGRREEPYDRENRGGTRKQRRAYLRRERHENKETELENQIDDVENVNEVGEGVK